MSAEATGWVYRYSPFRGATFSVHLAIADSVNDQHDQEFWMAIPTLARKARLADRDAQRAIHRLVAEGFLVQLRAGGGRETSLYSFLFKPGVAVAYGRPESTGDTMSPVTHTGDTMSPEVVTSLRGSGDTMSPNPNQIPSRSQKRERAQKKTAWHTLPETELLTPDRRELAREAGLHPARTAGEWQKFSMYYFARPKVDVDATWRNWVVRALDEPWSPPPDPKPPRRDREPGDPTRVGNLVEKIMSEAEKTRRALDARDREAERKDREFRHQREDVGL